jgi:hypothetical protein
VPETDLCLAASNDTARRIGWNHGSGGWVRMSGLGDFRKGSPPANLVPFTSATGTPFLGNSGSCE